MVTPEGHPYVGTDYEDVEKLLAVTMTDDGECVTTFVSEGRSSRILRLISPTSTLPQTGFRCAAAVDARRGDGSH